VTKKTQKNVMPSVISMSIGGNGNSILSLEITLAEANKAGIAVVVAAGNENSDAGNFWPAYVPDVITVGSTDKHDRRSGFSNYGSRIDIFAPGTNIMSADTNSYTAGTTMSGTSMACPAVAGAAALLLSNNPTLLAKAVRDTLVQNATRDAVADAKKIGKSISLCGRKERPGPCDNTTTH